MAETYEYVERERNQLRAAMAEIKTAEPVAWVNPQTLIELAKSKRLASGNVWNGYVIPCTMPLYAHPSAKDEAAERIAALPARAESADATIVALQSTIASLRAEVEGLRKDAVRYRWLRENALHPELKKHAWIPTASGDPPYVHVRAIMWDEVDAAMASTDTQAPPTAAGARDAGEKQGSEEGK